MKTLIFLLFIILLTQSFCGQSEELLRENKELKAFYNKVRTSEIKKVPDAFCIEPCAGELLQAINFNEDTYDKNSVLYIVEQCKKMWENNCCAPVTERGEILTYDKGVCNK